MRTIFNYKGKEYSYVVVDGEVVTFRIDKNIYENEIVFDNEMQKQLEAEFEAYEATLSNEEIKIWRRTRYPELGCNRICLRRGRIVVDLKVIRVDLD